MDVVVLMNVVVLMYIYIYVYVVHAPQFCSKGGKAHIQVRTVLKLKLQPTLLPRRSHPSHGDLYKIYISQTHVFVPRNIICDVAMKTNRFH